MTPKKKYYVEVKDNDAIPEYRAIFELDDHQLRKLINILEYWKQNFGWEDGLK
jgi:hypothetical protein